MVLNVQTFLFIFYFTEAMHYLDGRRHFQHAMGLTGGAGPSTRTGMKQ